MFKKKKHNIFLHAQVHVIMKFYMHLCMCQIEQCYARNLIIFAYLQPRRQFYSQLWNIGLLFFSPIVKKKT